MLASGNELLLSAGGFQILFHAVLDAQFGFLGNFTLFPDVSKRNRSEHFVNCIMRGGTRLSGRGRWGKRFQRFPDLIIPRNFKQRMCRI